MKSYLQLIAFLFCLLSIPTLVIGQSCEKLIWADEFDGTTLDASKWSIDIGNGCPELCGWGNNEQQYYSDAVGNVSVANGVLTITAKNDSLGGMSYSSGKILTKNTAAFRYGRIEARCKLPQTQGLWPAFWLLPTDKNYGEWPRSGEIDIMELLGNAPEKVLGTVHTGLPWTFQSADYVLPSPQTFSDTFHIFSLEWNEDTMRWYIDNQLYHETNSDSLMPWLPFNEDFYIILNVAVGGNLPGFTDSTTVLPQTMEVDWVRVYNRPDRLSIQGSQPVIGSTGIKYNTFDVQGANYIWTVPSGSTIAAGQGTSEITVDWGCTAGDVQLELQTDCDTAMLFYTINAFANVTIAGETIISQNQTGITYTVPTLAGGTYTWAVPSDAIIVSGQGTNEITVDWGCLAGDVSVSSTSTCANLSDTISIDLTTYVISGSSTVPANATARIYSIDNIPNTTYNWSAPSDATIVSGQGTNEVSIDFGTQDGTVSVDVTNSCGIETYLTPISIDPSNMYCDFDGVDLAWDDFGGAVFEKIPNPFSTGINTSGHVGKTRKDPGSQTWGGIYADLAGEMDLVSNPFIHMKVYSSTTGVVKLKLEDQTSGAVPVEVDLNQDTINQWVNMVWDFTGYPNMTFDRIALFFDFGNLDTSYWYFDDVIGKGYEFVNTEKVEALPIAIFPNPTFGQFTVDLNGNFDNAPTIDIQIINAQGQIIYQQLKQQTTSQFTLDVQHLPSGTYFVRLVGKELQYLKTIVKMD